MDIRKLLRETSRHARPHSEEKKGIIVGLKDDFGFFESDEYRSVLRLLDAVNERGNAVSEVGPSIAALDAERLHDLPLHLVQRLHTAFGTLRRSLVPVQAWLAEAPPPKKTTPLSRSELGEVNINAERLLDDLALAAGLQCAAGLREADLAKLDELVVSVSDLADTANENAQRIEAMLNSPW
jgi:hypothetical protein